MFVWTYPQDSAIVQEALRLRIEHRPILLVRLRCLESRLVNIGVEYLALDTGIDAFHAVAAQRLHQDLLRHLEAAVEIHQFLVVFRELLLRHVLQCTVEVVNAVEKVLGELLEGEVSCCVDFSLRLFLEVAVVGDLPF